MPLLLGCRWHLPCHAWLNKRQGTERTLLAFKAGELAEYRLRLHTSDAQGTGRPSCAFGSTPGWAALLIVGAWHACKVLERFTSWGQHARNA